jgi:AcrR family transcriptional regulator
MAEAAKKRNVCFETRCERFVEAAEALFLERGFTGTSVNEVVRRAGGSLATLYAQFPTKEALFEAVMSRRAAALFENLVRESSHADIEAELGGLAARLLDHVLSEHALAVYRLVIHEGPKLESVRKAFLVNAMDAFRQKLAEYFARAAEGGRMALDEPEAAADTFCSLVLGQLRTRAACAGAASVPKVQRTRHIQRAVRDFLRIYPPPARAQSR